MKRYSDIAQLVEQVAVNHLVPGSSPGVGAIYGEVTERLKVPVLKTGVARATVGSNPTLSATKKGAAIMPSVLSS